MIPRQPEQAGFNKFMQKIAIVFSLLLTTFTRQTIDDPHASIIVGCVY